MLFCLLLSLTFIASVCLISWSKFQFVRSTATDCTVSSARNPASFHRWSLLHIDQGQFLDLNTLLLVVYYMHCSSTRLYSCLKVIRITHKCDIFTLNLHSKHERHQLLPQRSSLQRCLNDKVFNNHVTIALHYNHKKASADCIPDIGYSG